MTKPTETHGKRGRPKGSKNTTDRKPPVATRLDAQIMTEKGSHEIRYASLADLIVEAADILRPDERLTVSQWAEKYRYVYNQGSYIGEWRNATTPYMIEPMDVLCSHDYDACIMAAPAQCGKTDALIINWLGYSIAGSPMDMIIYNPTMDMARDFSRRRVDRLGRHTKAVGALISPNKDNDNVRDKRYTNGVMISLAHPSVSELAGRPVPRVALTDYDRMNDDIDGEGAPFDLAAKRTTTFGSYKMALAESSPSRPIENPNWVAVKGSHEAPPTKGILGLYNRGDRRRWYWKCPRCGERFEGLFEMLRYDRTLGSPVDIADSTWMQCPHCQGRIEQSERHEMQQTGVWLRDGQYFKDGKIEGLPRKTRIASFWLRGVAAAFVTWGKLVMDFLAAEAEYEATGAEDALVKFYNTDLAEPYIPKAQSTQRLPEHLRNRALMLPEREVPEGVRALIACVDVQKNRFVVQVHGVAMGNPVDIYIIDRFEIRKSGRVDAEGDPYFVRPATYLEDWDLIEKEVMDKTYPLADGSGRVMAVTLTLCDSGGYSREKGESVTAMAYDFHRGLRRKGKAARFHLVKGVSSPNAPRASINYPDAVKKDALTAARGDVPVLMLNSNMLKDMVSNRLDCEDIGKGMIVFPDWLPIQFYQELCAETRHTSGWVKTAHMANEAWDLLYYCVGGLVSKLLMADRVDWSKPKPWLADWDENALVYKPVEDKEEITDNTPDESSWDRINQIWQ